MIRARALYSCFSTQMVAMRDFPRRTKREYFQTKKKQKMPIVCQNDWRDVGRPLSCSAFAIACFVVAVVIGTIIVSIVMLVLFCDFVYLQDNGHLLSDVCCYSCTDCGHVCQRSLTTL